MNHDPKTNRQSSEEEDLRQTLLELHYGLVDEDDATELRHRIETDPNVAKLWAETLVVAGKFAEAAKVTGQKVSTETKMPSPIATPANSISPDPPPVSRADPDQSDRGNRHSVSRPRRFLQLWLGSLATAATIAIAISAVRYRNELPESPPSALRVAVQPVAGSDTAARNEFLIAVGPAVDATVDATVETSTTSVADSLSFDKSMSVVPASISFKVLSKGAVLFFGTTTTTPSQPGRIRVPDNVAIPSDAVLHVDAETAAGQETVRITVPLEPTRCLTFVSTDRPVYRPGETVFFRSVTLNRRTLAAHIDVPVRYELVDASGAAVEGAAIEGVTERGVGNGAFTIPETAPGGTYQLVAKSLDGFFPDQNCELEVRRYRVVRLKTDLEFAKRSFSAGDRVHADLTVRRADDSIPVAAAASIKAVVDGNVVYQSTGALNINGELSVAFDLPKVIRDGEGTLTIAIDDGSVTETAARPIPIHTGRAQVDFYPEGGYLVGGVNNRVYFAARDTDGKPIEIAGEVLSQSGRMVAAVETVRDGMGRFEFKPESGQRYSLRITSPLDITETPWLPSVVEALPVLDTGVGVFEPRQPIAMTIRSTKRRQCIVRIVCRGELVGVKTMEVGIGETAISVPIQDRAAGVIRVTVLDAESKTARPLVERLVYRRGEKQLHVTANVDDKQKLHSPGESVRMTIKVTDENDRPVSGAVLGVSVVDDSALSLRQDDVPSIKTHFLLTSEIESPKDLEHADFYLSDDPDAATSLDLLLGTQGWRRFVSGTPTPDETFREALTRLLELDGQRSGLIAGTTTNDPTIAEQIRAYRIRVATAWSGFVSEVRIALMLIAVFWLIGLAIRPKKTTSVAAGILLLGMSLFLQSGCGSGEPYIVGAPESADVISDEDAKRYGDSSESSGAEAEMQDESMLAPPPSTTASLSRPESNSQGKDQPFVERVVRVFLGQRDAKTSTDVSQSRISPEQLERFAKSRDLDAQALADQLMEELRFPIRQYAHLHRPAEDDVRRDFAETLFWSPMMVTDSTGTATIRFDLSDSLTLFRVRVDGHSVDGRLGSGGGSVVTAIPIQVEPKLPLEVTAGDRIDLPVGLVNATRQNGTLDVELETDASLSATRLAAVTSLAAGGRSTEVFSIHVDPSRTQTDAKVRVSASLRGGTLSDQVERSVRIVPDGFPFRVSKSGSLSETASVSTELPHTIVGGSLTGTVELYPSTQSQLSAGLESILREPHGCFEQASASNYPNVMAYSLMQLDGVVDDRTERQTISLLRRGYRKLTRYECSTLGYEWFGNDPGHEALSAFGLMQFSEMATFIDIDQEMLERTRKWILSRRDGQGGFQRNPRHLHVWSVQQKVVNAYLLWAISQADLTSGDASRTMTDLSAEIDTMQAVALAADDAYLIALSAITLENVGRRDVAAKLLDRLTEKQTAAGSLDGETTVTQSGGLSRTAETTALAILAWVRSDSHRPSARKSAEWLIKNRRGGGFGSTQATVLALKALIAMHDKIDDDDAGQVEVVVDDKVIDTIRWQGQPADGVKWTMTPKVVQTFASNPKDRLTLRSDDRSPLPFTIQFAGQTTSPDSDPDCPITMDLRFGGKSQRETVKSGDSIDVIAEVKNATDVGRPMTVAVVGIPGGLEPVIEGLDKLRETGIIDFYELRGRQVVLYWRTLAPKETKRITVSCVASVGGKYTGPPSHAYLYYTAESKTWHQPLVVEVR